jgi:uncharacterized membrane protein YfhO
MRTIYASNFESLRTMLMQWKTEGILPFWSWVSFLGNDFYSSKLFYFNDLWEYFFAFTSMPYTEAILWMTYLRFLTAGFCFYAYARHQKYGSFACLTGSLLWCFSAYLLQIMRDPFFASFITFLPLYFLAIDRYLEQNHHGFYIFMVFFMFFNSYYLFYMTSLFTIVYFLWKYDAIHGSLKGFLKPSLKLIGFYGIGFLLSGVIVVPEIINILNNSRVGERSMVLVYESLVPYLEYLSALFTPVSMVAYRGTAISDLYLWNTPNHQIMAAYVWAGSLTAFLVPQLLKNKSERRRTLAVLVFASVVSLVPICSSIMHGFSEPSYRWTANFTFMLVAMILPYLEDLNRINSSLQKIMTWVVPGLLAVTPLLFSAMLDIPFEDIAEDCRLLWICAAGALFIGLALQFKKKVLLFVLSVVELSYVSYFTYYGNPTQSAFKSEDINRVAHALGEKNEFMNWTLGLDENNSASFYRIYVDPTQVYWDFGTNYNLDENIRGLMIYDSTYLASTNDLIRLDPDRVIDYLPWTFDIQNPDIMTLVSTKYAVVGPGCDSPFRNSVKVNSYAGYDVYLNTDFINLGKTYTSIETYEDYDPQHSQEITRKVICHAEDFSEIQSLLGTSETMCSYASTAGNSLFAHLDAKEDGFAVFSVPYDKGWQVTINGQTVKTYEVNGGLTGLPVTKGTNEIQMTFTPQGLKKGAILSLLGMIFVCLVAFLDLRRAFHRP